MFCRAVYEAAQALQPFAQQGSMQECSGNVATAWGNAVSMVSPTNLIYYEPIVKAMLMKTTCSSEASWSCAHDEHSNLQAQRFLAQSVASQP